MTRLQYLQFSRGVELTYGNCGSKFSLGSKFEKTFATQNIVYNINKYVHVFKKDFYNIWL